MPHLFISSTWDSTCKCAKNAHMTTVIPCFAAVWNPRGSTPCVPHSACVISCVSFLMGRIEEIYIYMYSFVAFFLDARAPPKLHLAITFECNACFFFFIWYLQVWWDISRPSKPTFFECCGLLTFARCLVHTKVRTNNLYIYSPECNYTISWVQRHRVFTLLYCYNGEETQKWKSAWTHIVYSH